MKIYLKNGFYILMLTVSMMLLTAVPKAYAIPLIPGTHVVMSNAFDSVALIVIGLFVGIIGTLIGAGGGFLVVPILILFYGFTPQHAIGTSTAVVFLNALSGTFSYMVQKKVDYELGVKFSVIAAPCVIVGALIAQKFTPNVFAFLFSIILILLCYFLIFVRDFHLVTSSSNPTKDVRVLVDSSGRTYTYYPDLSIGFAASSIIGLISGLFGIGGGLVHVPLMNFIGIPIHIATATSHFVISITSVFGILIFIALGTIDIDYAIFIGVGSILGAYIGANIAAITSPEIIKKIMAVVLLFAALKLILSVIL
ncbi:MAG: sulfite exporter TauE/SafE family protein [Nitrospirae bacterium]|nr:sulfite exporter TauE/SafE family protein [Nitrospirota bacterium]